MGLTRKCHEDGKLCLKAPNSYSDVSLISSLMLGVTIVVVSTFPGQGKSLSKLKEVTPLIPVPGSPTLKASVLHVFTVLVSRRKQVYTCEKAEV